MMIYRRCVKTHGTVIKNEASSVILMASVARNAACFFSFAMSKVLLALFAAKYNVVYIYIYIHMYIDMFPEGHHQILNWCWTNNMYMTNKYNVVVYIYIFPEVHHQILNWCWTSNMYMTKKYNVVYIYIPWSTASHT